MMTDLLFAAALPWILYGLALGLFGLVRFLVDLVFSMAKKDR